MPVLLLVAFTFIAISVDGLHGSTTAGFVLVIVLASLLTGQKAIPLATILTLLGVWTVAYADMTGINKSVFAQRTDLAYVVVVSVIQIVAATTLNGLMTRLNSALEVSRANEQAQIRSNQELSELQTVLEQRVAERTHSLELAAEVGRNVAQVHDLDSLLKSAVDLIQDRFNLYYTQVYLLDPTGRELVLRAGTGEAGQQLLGRRHSLPVDLASLNGTAAVEKHTVIVERTETSTIHRPNPLLPDTRSEMVVPLLIGERVVGTLDMQSSQADALNKENLAAFEALAGQLAIAVENADLLAETETARATVEAQSRRLIRSGWQDFLNAIERRERIGFNYDLDKVTSFDEPLLVEPDGRALATAIQVSNEPVGMLKFEGEQSWSEEDAALVKSVAHQLGQQVENLRLLAQTDEYRARAEQALRRLTREGWKDYTDANAAKGLSYMYDLNQVRLYDGERQIEASAASLSLKVREEPIGDLVIQGLESGDSESVELANAVAERLGAHIESLRQQKQTQSALAQSEKMFQASRSLTQAADLQELVKATIETINIPAVSRAILATLTYNAAGKLEGGTVVANWWNGTGTEAEPVGQSYSVDNVQAMSMFLSSTPMFINDVFNDERIDPASMQIAKSQNTRTVAALPLFLGTRQIGALLLEGEEPHNFAQDEVRLFSALAPQIATVLENRRQYERAQKQAERETTLNVIGQKIRSATTVEAVLQIAARELGHALGAPLTIAQLGLKDKK